MNSGSVRLAYDILIRIYREGAYINSEMKRVTGKRTAKLVYGVTDKHYELNYIVDVLTSKPVKPSVKPLLLIGVYSIKYLHTPLNVVINETGEILTDLGKSGLKPFFSAVFNKVARGEYEMPKKSDRRYAEVKYNLPSFLIGMFKKDYPDTYEEIIEARNSGGTHIRLKKGVAEDVLLNADRGARKSLTGFFVNNNKEISMLNFEGKLTYMSYTSTLIAESAARVCKENAVCLDCCAAPGGKSVYLAERGNEVTACDIYPHRVELINAYAGRMKVNLTTRVCDSTEYNKAWDGKFDVVLCDVPCSGMGVIGRRKDVVFNKTYEDIAAITKLQAAIIENASRYVKIGGYLIYSTCTVFKAENDRIIEEFLAQRDNFELSKIPLPFENDGKIQFLPDGKDMEGFFICHLKRKA